MEMQMISRAHMWLLNALKFLAGLVVLMIFVMIVLDVGATMLNISPWEGTIGFVEYGMLWFTMLAAPWLARIKGHVFIDALTQLFSPAVQNFAARFAYLVAIIGSSAFCYYSTLLVVEAFEAEQIDERGIEMLNWWLYAPMPIAFFLVAVEFLRFLLGFDNMYGSRTDVREGM